MTFKTTPRHFAIFKAECERCIKLYRIVGWRVEYMHDHCDGNRAECRTKSVDQVAVLSLGTDWGDQIAPTDALVRKSARHEVIHLVIDRLAECAHSRWITNDQYQNALEATVRHLEEILP